jgi:branched-chain amino acid aminotransferase
VSEVVWIDGSVVDAAEAMVPVTDRGFLYGDSVYEVLRAIGLKPQHLGRHLDRLESSAKMIELPLPERTVVEDAVAAALAACAEADAYVRIVVTRGGGPISLDPSLADGPRLLVLAKAATPPPPSAYQHGVEVALVGFTRGGAGVDPRVKSGNYLPSVLGAAEARRRGAYECVFSDPYGRLTEGGSSNIFVVQGNAIWTPPVSSGLLPGITRGAVLELARDVGLVAGEKPLWRADLMSADEAFMTSSIRGVVPVVRVDGANIASGVPGPITRRIEALYAASVA